MTINEFIKRCKKLFGDDIQYKATSKDGQVFKTKGWRDDKVVANKLKTLDFTKRWRVTVTDAKLNRSLEQNERLWELYTSLSQHLGIEKDLIHQLCGYKFLRYQTEIAGMPVELIKSTTKLTTSEMTEYQQQIEVWGQTMGWGWDY